jgi:hypothetical protein
MNHSPTGQKKKKKQALCSSLAASNKGLTVTNGNWRLNL